MAGKKDKGKNKPPANETKLQRFIRVVTPRVSKATKSIKLIGNCAGNNYECTDEQLSQIESALLCAVQDVIAKYNSTAKSAASFAFTGE